MSIIAITDTLLSIYRKRDLKNHPFIVGIDGLGGAGKTIFVK
jgi:pantothenate kinase-related protein Tda10